MEYIVILALTVLAAVFLVSLFIFIVLCFRRRDRIRLGNLKFSHLQDESPGTLSDLSPQIVTAFTVANILLPLGVSLMMELSRYALVIPRRNCSAAVLDKNSWVYDVTGLLQHCVALLRLCHTVTEKLAAVPFQADSAQLGLLLTEATLRVRPRFDDLLSAVASPRIDVRVLEARAVSLCTVCWALYFPFVVLNPKYKEMLGDPLNEMNSHLVVLREAAEIAEKVEISKVAVDWEAMKDDDEDDEAEDEASVATTVVTIETKNEPPADMSKSKEKGSTEESACLIKRTASGSHPVDPAV